MQKRSSNNEQLQNTVNQDHENAGVIKNQAAVLLGRLGGLKGGKARAEKLSPKKRSQIARRAAQARWSREEL
jgi:hypothetical protein